MSNLEQIIRPFATEDVTPTEVHPAGAVAAPPILLQIGRRGASKTCSMSYSASQSTYIAEEWGVAEIGYHINTVHQVDSNGIRTGNTMAYNVIEWVAYQSVNGGIKVVTSGGSHDKGGPNTDVGPSLTRGEIPWPFPLNSPTGGVTP
jgi:hypothetical protein